MTISLTDRELAAVLAALRSWRQDRSDKADAFHGVLTTLTVSEVDALCERLATAPEGGDPFRAVVEEFVRDIDGTGGVLRDPRGYTVPCADEDWVDLGTTYVRACAALGRAPAWAGADEEDASSMDEEADETPSD